MVSAESTIVKEDFTYDEGKYLGFIAYDSAKEGKLPGVLVLHAGPGFNDYVKRRATMIAELGYIGFACDLVGGGRGYKGPEEADASLVPFDTVRDKFYKAYDLLKAHEKCDPTKIAGIGYCYGGIVLMNLVRLGADLRGIASFHGPVRPFVPRIEKGKYKGKVLACIGELDSQIPKEEIVEWKKEFDEAGVDYKVVIYPDTYHAFTNPAMGEKKPGGPPIAYNEKSDKESWAELVVLLKDIFSD